MPQYQLIWAIAGLFALSGVLWAVLANSRTRLKYTWLLLCAALVFALVPLRTPWLNEVALALAELAALHLFTLIVFRIVLKKLDLPMIASDLVVIAGYAIVVLTLLAHLGVNVAGLVATSAVLAAVLGLALQDLLANLVSGLSIHADGAIHVGQWIQCEHGTGRVLRVRLRYTSLQTAEGDVLIVPNHTLTKGPVTIFAAERRTFLRFRLGPEHRPTHIIEIVEDALTASPIPGLAANPRPRCFLMEHDIRHIEYGVHVWVTRVSEYEQTISDVLNRLYFALSRVHAPVASIVTAVELRNPTPASDQHDFEVAKTALKKSPLWNLLRDEEVELIAQRLKRDWFARGEAIVKQGAPGDSMFVVLRGSVKVMLASDSAPPQQIATLESGSFFGEMSLLTGDNRTASVIALDNVECGELHKEHLTDILVKRPELANQISATLEQRQIALASARDKMRTDAIPEKAPDLLARIQQFFGIARKL